MSGHRPFEFEWPEMAGRLHRLLASRSVPLADREDIIQETALRLMRIWPDIDHSRPVFPLATTIAMNLLRSEVRRKGRQEIVVGEIEDRPSRIDVEQASLARFELRRVARAMDHLSPTHRELLLQEVSPTVVSGPSAPAVKMQRMRARRRLAVLLETASVSLWLAVLRLRRTLDAISPSTTGALAAVAVATAMLPGGPGARPAVEGMQEGWKLAEAPVAAPGGGDRSHFEAVSQAMVQDRTQAKPGVAEIDEVKPVRVPLGDGGVDVSGEASVDDDLWVEVRDGGGPVPACVGGLDPLPSELDCEAA